MNHQELYKLLQTVQKNIRCPQCGREYTFAKIAIRGIVDSVVFLELSCKNHMPLLATVALARNPVRKSAKNRKQINSDDIIETHQFLEQFSGSFEQIFKKK